MNNPKLGIRKILVVFGIVLLSSSTPLGVTAYLQARAPVSSHGRANSLGAELDRLLLTRLKETFTFAALPSVRAFAAATADQKSQRAAVALDELQALVAADTQIREVFVVDSSGLVSLSTGRIWNTDWSSRGFVKAALTGKLDVSAPSHDANEFSQYYAGPILDNRGSIAGALVVRVAAQELWSAVKDGSEGGSDGIYAVLVDENGVRIADGGDPARVLVALSPLTTEQQELVMQEQSYGAQTTILHSSNFQKAAELISSGNALKLAPEDIGSGEVVSLRLSSKPWTLLLVTPTLNWQTRLIEWILPLLAALAMAGIATVVLTRYAMS